MKAVRFHEHGPPAVLHYEEAPDPLPRPGAAIVRVRACALNHLDLWQRRGMERVRLPLPHISGSDVAGEVVDGGGGPLAAGTRVMLQPGLSCGVCPMCLDDRDNLCASYDVLGLMSDGGYSIRLTRRASATIAMSFPRRPGSRSTDARHVPLARLRQHAQAARTSRLARGNPPTFEGGFVTHWHPEMQMNPEHGWRRTVLGGKAAIAYAEFARP